MPVLNQTTLSSPPTNAFGLVQYLQQRLPGYDPSEYLREINSAYIHVWEEISKLKNHYFTNIVTVTVAKAQFQYDLMFNADAGLSAAVSQRLYQVTRIRVLPPGGGLYQSTSALTPNSPDFIALSANPSTTPTLSGPYYWYLNGRNQVNFAMPLAVGTTLEVTYTFWPIALTYMNNGTVSSAAAVVTGVSTNFTQIVPPDFQTSLPTVQGQEEVLTEFIASPVSGFTQSFRVKTITNDTNLTLQTAPNPVLPASTTNWTLSTVPEIPREHIRVIGSIAMTKIYSVDGDDARVAEWSAISMSNMQMMKDSLMERQSNNPPTKQRFPYGIGRRNRMFMR